MIVEGKRCGGRENSPRYIFIISPLETRPLYESLTVITDLVVAVTGVFFLKLIRSFKSRTSLANIFYVRILSKNTTKKNVPSETDEYRKKKKKLYTYSKY